MATSRVIQPETRPAIPCRCCDLRTDVKWQPGLAQSDGYWMLTCWNSACPMNSYTVNADDYLKLDLFPYLRTRLSAWSDDEIAAYIEGLRANERLTVDTALELAARGLNGFIIRPFSQYHWFNTATGKWDDNFYGWRPVLVNAAAILDSEYLLVPDAHGVNGVLTYSIANHDYTISWSNVLIVQSGVVIDGRAVA